MSISILISMSKWCVNVTVNVNVNVDVNVCACAQPSCSLHGVCHLIVIVLVVLVPV